MKENTTAVNPNTDAFCLLVNKEIVSNLIDHHMSVAVLLVTLTMAVTCFFRFILPTVFSISYFLKSTSA